MRVDVKSTIKTCVRYNKAFIFNKFEIRYRGHYTVFQQMYSV